MYTKQRKLLSQNFLWNRVLVNKLIRSSSLSSQDTVLEIGPGKGIITKELSLIANHVYAIEKDKQLYEQLLLQIKTLSPNITLIHKDIFLVPLPTKPYKVFSNIPFNRTAEIIRYLLESNSPLIDCYLVMQKEAAKKFIMKKDNNSLAATIYAPFWQINCIYQFQRSDFYPCPNVDSVLVRFQPKTPPFPSSYKELYKDLVTHEFIYNRDAKHYSYLEWISVFQRFKDKATLKQIQTVKGSFALLRNQQKKLQKIYRTRNDKRWKKL